MTIKGRKKQELTIESILALVSEFQIYSFYMPHRDWELDKVTYSPFKPEEKNPSFIIGTKYGSITHKAFNDDTKKGDCFKFVKQLYNLSTLNDVLERIDFDMNLGIRSIPSKDYNEIVKEYKDPVITKKNTLIQVKTRKFTKEDLDYWASYFQTEQDLKEANIYSVKELFINKKRFPLKVDELRFGYYYSGKWKIYIPLTDDKRRKWLSNIPLTTTYGLENLNKDKNTIVAKSLKDYLVLRKIYSNICHVQNESLAAFSEETINYINENSKNVYCSFDSDESGKKASWEVTKSFGWKHVNPPDNLLPKIKDISDWARIKGLEEVKNHLIKKNII